MPQKIATIRHWRSLLLVGAATGFLAASLQIAAPLHAAQCSGPSQASHRPCSDPSDTSEHDSDRCAVCHFLFGLSGKSLLPLLAPEPVELTLVFDDTIFRQHVFNSSSPCKTIPRAPPV